MKKITLVVGPTVVGYKETPEEDGYILKNIPLMEKFSKKKKICLSSLNDSLKLIKMVSKNNSMELNGIEITVDLLRILTIHGIEINLNGQKMSIKDRDLSPKSLDGKKIVLVDTHSVLNRMSHGMPSLLNGEGKEFKLLRAMNSILNRIRWINPDYAIMCTEGYKTRKGSRKGLYFPDYKGKEVDQEMHQSINEALEYSSNVLPVAKYPGYEADDTIASLAKKYSSLGAEVIIISADKDLFQLIEDGKVIMYDYFKKSYINAEYVEKKLGVKPNMVLELLSLMGDSSDNLPGAKGIGQGKGSKLLLKYGSLENIYKNLEDIGGVTAKNILDSKVNVGFTYKMVSLNDHLHQNNQMPQPFNKEAVKKFTEANEVLFKNFQQN